MYITFLPQQVTLEVESGISLLQGASKAGVFIDASCGGNSSCGKCKVFIESGNPGPLTDKEKELLNKEEMDGGCRLACQIQVMEDLSVRIPGRKSAACRKSALLNIPDELNLNPEVHKKFVQVSLPDLENPAGYLEQLEKVLEWKPLLPLTLLKALPGVLEQGKGQLTVTFNSQHQVIRLEAGNREDCCYGIAFDIGTTTVVGMLWDLNQGALVGIHSRNNPQGVFGGDVISRICYAGESVDNLEQIHQKIIGGINEIVQVLCQENQIKPDWIYDITVVGNTSMGHIFLGIDPISLAGAPFNPVFTSGLDIPAAELGIGVCPLANVHLLPGIAGHVGSDITAGILAGRLKESAGMELFIDVGTNGEIVLFGNGKALTASTAAGPAFEGASIHHGMRAASGAIETVKIDDGEVLLGIIGDEEPMGICGSGLIDSISELLRVGLINNKGRLLSKDEALQQCFPQRLAERLIGADQGKAFILAVKQDGNPVLLTQKDIREMQLAKGAIYAGIQIMLKMMDAEIRDIGKVSIAGAFGSYINKESAVRIGLFPAVDPERIVSAGNLAGVGSSMCLLSKVERRMAVERIKSIQHVELALHPDFQRIYMKSMYFS